MKHMQYSWIVPIYNEAESLPRLLSEIVAAAGKTPFEIIAINDGSTDATRRTLGSLAKQIPLLRVVNLPTRLGKWAALALGVKLSVGRRIITLDSDLQDDPREVITLIHMMDKGYDLVSGWRKRRRDPLYKVIISRLGNALVSWLTTYRYYDLNAPLKLYKREVFDSIPTTGSLLRFSLLFAHAVGFKTTEVPIVHRPRRFGQSKFGLQKYVRVIYDLCLILLLFSGSGRIARKGKNK